MQARARHSSTLKHLPFLRPQMQALALCDEVTQRVDLDHVREARVIPQAGDAPQGSLMTVLQQLCPGRHTDAPNTRL